MAVDGVVRASRGGRWGPARPARRRSRRTTRALRRPSRSAADGPGRGRFRPCSRRPWHRPRVAAAGVAAAILAAGRRGRQRLGRRRRRGQQRVRCQRHAAELPEQVGWSRLMIVSFRVLITGPVRQVVGGRDGIRGRSVAGGRGSCRHLARPPHPWLGRLGVVPEGESHLRQAAGQSTVGPDGVVDRDVPLGRAGKRVATQVADKRNGREERRMLPGTDAWLGPFLLDCPLLGRSRMGSAMPRIVSPGAYSSRQCRAVPVLRSRDEDG